jgi:hypothetical protein
MAKAKTKTNSDKSVTGMATNTFVDLPRIKEAQALADYTSIEHDLWSAREFAKLYLKEFKNLNTTFIEAFMIATIVRYARPFVTGIRLRLPDPAGILTDDQLAKHQRFRDIRDKYIAHSVNAFEENPPVARYWVETVQTEGIESVECMHSRIVGLGEDDFKDALDLTNTWLAYVQEKSREEKVKVLAVVRGMPLETILRGYKGPVKLDTSRPDKRRKPFAS